MIDPFWIFEGLLALGAGAAAIYEWKEGERGFAVGAAICCGFGCYIIVYAATHR